MTRAVLAAFRRYAWPGNIRELRNVLERVAVLRAGKRVRVEDLPRALQPDATRFLNTEVSDRRRRVEVRLDQPLRRSVAQIIEAALELEQGNHARAAQRLGISARTIQRHLAQRAVEG
jgi:DNA-binding NtrC family response regulator